MTFVVHHGDCREVMATLDAESVDAVVCDPPYGLSFMGKGWDHGVPGEEFWTEALRVAKPGAHLLAFGGTRTYHRLACAIEDAGWEIRDCVMWVYGSGFPKSHDVSKAIDKAAGAERPRVSGGQGGNNAILGARKSGEAISGEAIQWSGWGTALKPAWEPIIVARKPLVGTVAENVLTHGTGGIKVDGCRVGTDGTRRHTNHTMRGGNFENHSPGERINCGSESGRWPANLIHDGSNGPSSLLGSAARFFYCAKASKADRDEGCEGMKPQNNMRVNGPRESEEAKHATKLSNHHPTVKPTSLMRYLCRLVTPPGGVVLDPFTGSGSTGKAAVLEGFDFVGIEREAEYVEIARARIAAAVLPLEATA